MKKNHVLIAIIAIAAVAYFYHMKSKHNSVGGMI